MYNTSFTVLKNYLAITIEDKVNNITVFGNIELEPCDSVRNWYNFLRKDLRFKLHALRLLKEQHPNFYNVICNETKDS